jgi:steroid 5-alpha reductase family enzyme
MLVFFSPQDFSGSTNFILLAVLSLVLSGTYHPRQVMLTVMLIVSRLWLAGFLLYRVLQRGHDARFDEMRSKFFAFLGFWVFQVRRSAS